MHDATAAGVRQPSNGPGSPPVQVSLTEDKPSGSAELHVDDTSLVEAALHDRAAFALLYRRYATPIYRYFYQRVGSMEDAEDLTSTTFSRALSGLDRYEARGSFAAWLFGIARHTLLDHRRVQYAHGVPEDVQSVVPPPADATPGPEEQTLRTEQSTRLRQLVDRLSEDQREALVLRVFGELSTRDVAAVLGKSEAAVKMLVHRAVEALRLRYAGDSLETRE